MQLVAMCVVGVLQAAQPPAVFTELDLEHARSVASEADKLLIVDATAVWCVPCRRMDATTWVDPDVERWLESRAVCIQLDVDEEEDRARELSIRAMPTIIVFRNGKELDRVIGYQSGEELIDWLDGVVDGRTHLDRLRARADSPANPDERVDVMARYRLANTLAQNREFDEAIETYVWLWRHGVDHDPMFRAIRPTLMLTSLSELAAWNQSAKDALRELRDQTSERLESTPKPTDLRDWLLLNRAMGDEQTTLAWIERVERENGLATLRRVAPQIEELLLRHAKWALYGRMLVDPVARIRAKHAGAQESGAMVLAQLGDQSMADYIQGEQMADFRLAAGDLHAGLLAAGRDDEAWRVLETALELGDSQRIAQAVLRAALTAGQARRRHLDFVDLSGDDRLRKLILAALEI